MGVKLRVKIWKVDSLPIDTKQINDRCSYKSELHRPICRKCDENTSDVTPNVHQTSIKVNANLTHCCKRNLIDLMQHELSEFMYRLATHPTSSRKIEWSLTASCIKNSLTFICIKQTIRDIDFLVENYNYELSILQIQ